MSERLRCLVPCDDVDAEQQEEVVCSELRLHERGTL